LPAQSADRDRPVDIRWGPEASSNMLRSSARCGRCGRKGVTLQHPSWRGSAVGWRRFRSA